MTNLIKKLSKTKISESSKQTFAKILLKDLENKPELIQEYRFLAVLMEVDHIIFPVTNTNVLN